jgi:nucleotide-binding universal stress UspA family protein
LFRHILVPLDGSILAEAALPVADMLAVKLHAKVTLLHAIERDAPDEVHGQHHLKGAGEATAYLSRVARDSLSKGIEVDFHVHTAEVDNVAENIVAHAEELGYDLIVMCTHGKGKALHMILGSIAEKIISGGRLPVCVVRPSPQALPTVFSCNTLLAPLDGDPDHENALESAREIGRACGALLYLVMVVPGLSDLSGERAAASRFLPGTTSKMLELSMQDGGQYLEELAGGIRGEGIKVETRVMRGEPASTIAETARSLGAGLVVLGTHGKSGMAAFWAGSVAHRVSSQSTVPLLLVPLKKE